MSKLIETLEAQVSEKGKEINAYIEKHNIQVKGGASNNKKAAADDDSKEGAAGQKQPGSSGVLVSSSNEKSWSNIYTYTQKTGSLEQIFMVSFIICLYTTA